MRVIFFGTANVALPILEALKKQHKILAVVTNPDAAAGRSKKPRESPVSALAKDLSLVTLKPEKVKNNPEFLAQLQNLNADIFVVVAYGKILPREIINLPRLKAINVHFSALPLYRGPSPIQYALLNGAKQTGSSVFVLDEKVDDGPLLWQQLIEIDSSDNFFTLSDKLSRLSANAINQVIANYDSGTRTPLPQDGRRATFTKIITKQDGKITWQNSAEQIHNQFRAFFLWPGIWTEHDGKKIKILHCVPSAESSSENPGTVLPGGAVACGGGSILQIKSLKPEGKNEMDIAEFLNGHQEFVGGKLG